MHFPPAFAATMDTPGARVIEFDTVAIETERFPLLRHSRATTFNCATFALGDIVGLGPNDWIEPLARSDTLYTVPAQVILDSYCQLIAEYSTASADWQQLARDDGLLDGDILCFAFETAGTQSYVHMGKIRKVLGRNLLVSKLGVGPIAEMSLQLCAENYSYDSVKIFRRL